MLHRIVPFRCSAAFGGPGYIAGELSNDPAVPDGIVTVNDVPAARQVEVRERVTRRVLAVVFSNADGTYRIDGLSPEFEFDVIGRDWKREFQDVIIGAVRPQPYGP